MEEVNVGNMVLYWNIEEKVEEFGIVVADLSDFGSAGTYSVRNPARDIILDIDILEILDVWEVWEYKKEGGR